MQDPLLTPRVLQSLERLRLATRRPLPGPRHGDLRSPRLGLSQEFADYREYHPGDDERRIDWHVAARTDELVVRLFEGEENVRVELLIDQSASMDFGEPSKLDFARSVAAALGFVALRSGHEVHLAGFADGVVRSIGPLAGRKSIAELLQGLAGWQAQGSTDTLQAFAHKVHEQPRPGLTFVLSDLYDTEGLFAGLKRLRGTGREVYVFHTLSRGEVEPPAEGAYEWMDAETDGQLQVTLDPHTLSLYQSALDEWTHGIRSFCSGLAIRYLQLVTDRPIEELLFLTLRKEGVLH